MTLAAFLNPVHAAGAVHLGAPLVLNNVPCEFCYGLGTANDVWKPKRVHECPSCAGSGFVAPEVTPGQHLAIATTRTEPDLGRHHDGCYVDHYNDIGWAMDDAADFPEVNVRDRRVPLHLGSVVGSVTATTPALPIHDDRWPPPTKDPYLEVSGDRLVLWGEAHTTPFGGYDDLSEWLPWLGDDLVGRWAVLTTDARPFQHRESMGDCPCPDRDAGLYSPQCFAPVPLPDGVDHPAGTLTEVQW